MRLFSILLLSLIMMHNCSKIFIFINYEIYKKQITEEYCVNKNNPMAHCNGMCHMIKQMQKDEKQSKQENIPYKSQTENLEIIMFSLGKEDIRLNNYITGDHAYSVYQIVKISSLSTSFFHPPAI
jgi:hypothetical protein